jgi:hypothetical protein
MSRIDKLKNRLLSYPKDFTWDELKKFLLSIGYTEISLGKTSGSRVRFVNDDHPPIVLHKPHPKLIMKGYQLKQIVQHLSKEGLL